MASYRELARDLIAADGVIDDTETKLLKKHLYADKKIVMAELAFLGEVRTAVKRKHKDKDMSEFAKFDRFYMKALGDHIAEEGIDDSSLAMVKKIAKDDSMDSTDVKKFLNKLKKDTGDEAVAKVADDFAAKN